VYKRQDEFISFSLGGQVIVWNGITAEVKQIINLKNYNQLRFILYDKVRDRIIVSGDNGLIRLDFVNNMYVLKQARYTHDIIVRKFLVWENNETCSTIITSELRNTSLALISPETLNVFGKIKLDERLSNMHDFIHTPDGIHAIITAQYGVFIYKISDWTLVKHFALSCDAAAMSMDGSRLFCMGTDVNVYHVTPPFCPYFELLFYSNTHKPTKYQLYIDGTLILLGYSGEYHTIMRVTSKFVCQKDPQESKKFTVYTDSLKVDGSSFTCGDINSLEDAIEIFDAVIDNLGRDFSKKLYTTAGILLQYRHDRLQRNRYAIPPTGAEDRQNRFAGSLMNTIRYSTLTRK
jgi:hypothetical protein